MQMVWGIKTGKIGCMDNRLHGCMKRSRKTKDNFHFLCMQIGKIYCCGKGRWDYCTKKEKEPQYLVFNILVHTKYRGFHSNKKSSDAFLTGGQPSCECLLQCRCNVGTAIAGAAIAVPMHLAVQTFRKKANQYSFIISQRVTMQRKKSIYFGSLCRTTSYSSTPAATEAFRLSA